MTRGAITDRQKDYTLTLQHPRWNDPGVQYVSGFRNAIGAARDFAAREYCTVVVRNEDGNTWNVAFRVRGGRRGAYTTVEVTRASS
jgi:hypothetical protein